MSENLSKTAAGLRPARIPVVTSTTPAAPSSLHVALDESHVCALQLTSSTRATASAAEREVTSAIDEAAQLRPLALHTSEHEPSEQPSARAVDAYHAPVHPELADARMALEHGSEHTCGKTPRGVVHPGGQAVQLPRPSAPVATKPLSHTTPA